MKGVAPKKLTARAVTKIRELYATGKHTQKELGQQFGVSQPLVGRIVRRELWDHVP